ncbi:PRD domain-containing protein [Halocella sp. SP3-1]|uniref:PRD domain-containing protein n=1 Tax=Halocella sp. SP3-1 TaxID=2382161 RepID=UPI000F763837|nr:PRD domain-containing protein [Halocella sp. SP3-1]AZO93507.1 PRD domain-containing protein [Halocella sp. SP3-1]
MSDRSEYIVLKVLNNNVVLAKELSAAQEMVLIGKGIGFQCKTGKKVQIPVEKIEKSFITYSKPIKNKYLQLINELDGQILGIGEEIIALAENELGDLDPHVHIALTDHIAFTIERLNNGMDISNPFLEEIKILYNQEFRLGVKAADLIKERLSLEIPESEVGFIAMHLHAAREKKKVSQTVRNTSLIRHLVEMVEEELNIKINPLNLTYTRLVNHLRCSLDRLKNNKKVRNPLVDRIKKEFGETFKIAQNLGARIEESLKVVVNEDELAYITLHLHRLKDQT